MALTTFDQPELERFTRTFKELFDAADPDSMTRVWEAAAPRRLTAHPGKRSYDADAATPATSNATPGSRTSPRPHHRDTA